MSPKFPKKDMFGYFRMGLVTGLVDKQDLIAWADREILVSAVPEDDLIELSLSAHLPHSQIIRLLTSYQGLASYKTPLKLLFSVAGMQLEQDERNSVRIIQGLRLLIEEEYLDKELKSRLAALDGKLDAYRQGQVTHQYLYEYLWEFLIPYNQYRPLLRGLL